MEKSPCVWSVLMFAAVEIMNRYVSSFTSVPPPLQPSSSLQTQPAVIMHTATTSKRFNLKEASIIWRQKKICSGYTYYSSVCTQTCNPTHLSHTPLHQVSWPGCHQVCAGDGGSFYRYLSTVAGI